MTTKNKSPKTTLQTMITVKFLFDASESVGFGDEEVVVGEVVVGGGVVSGVTGSTVNDTAFAVTGWPDGRVTMKLPDSITLCSADTDCWKSSRACPFVGTKMKDTFMLPGDVLIPAIHETRVAFIIISVIFFLKPSTFP